MSPSLDLRENREFASEIKFQVEQRVAEEIMEWARGRMSPDPNGAGAMSDAYQISSLYFDTEQFDVFARNGSFGRTKYRIRRYGPSEIVFLERKLKTGGLVTKRRAAVEMRDLQRLSEEEADPGWPGFWFHQRLLARRLRPVCQITYRRTARVSITNYGPIRLTLDQDVKTVPLLGMAFENGAEATRLSGEQIIVEMKYRVNMPASFKDLVERFGLNAKRVSKYRLAVVALGLVREPANEAAATPLPTPEDPICLTS
jgi:SPX domain protein involved in polyphosphate accumulation